MSPLEEVTMLLALVTLLVLDGPGWARHAGAPVLLLLHCHIVEDTLETAPGLPGISLAGDSLGVQCLLPVLQRDQADGDTHGDVGPLQGVLITEHLLPPALDSSGEGNIVATTLETHGQTFKTLTGSYRSEQSLS